MSVLSGIEKAQITSRIPSEKLSKLSSFGQHLETDPDGVRQFLSNPFASALPDDALHRNEVITAYVLAEQEGAYDIYFASMPVRERSDLLNLEIDKAAGVT